MSLDQEKRAEIREEHSNECHFCGGTEQLEVHHIVPLGAGGSDEDENLEVLCKSCHYKVEEFTRRLREKLPESQQDEIKTKQELIESQSGTIVHMKMRMWDDGYPLEMVNDIMDGGDPTIEDYR